MDLTPPAPDSTPGHRETYGDHYDDDAEIMDALVRDQAVPPTPAELPKDAKPLEETTAKRQPITRLMTRNLEVSSTWDPVLMFPSDPNRISLTIYAFSEQPTNWLRWGDDAGKVMSLMGSAKIYSGQLLEFTSNTHTGPIWVYGPDLTVTTCNIVAIAITI